MRAALAPVVLNLQRGWHDIEACGTWSSLHLTDLCDVFEQLQGGKLQETRLDKLQDA